MAKHIVKCPKCGESFDTNLIQAVKISARRYGHATCYPDIKDFVPMEQSQQDPDLIKLKNYIDKKYGDKAKWPLINRQIKIFTKDKGYSLSGILKSLVWFYDIKGNSIEGSNGGIGIAEYAYQDAYNYYYNLFIAQNQNKDKDIAHIITKTKEITIPLPQITLNKRLFNLDDEVLDNEQE